MNERFFKFCSDSFQVVLFLAWTLRLLLLHMSLAVSDFCDLMNYRPPGSSVHGIFQQDYWNGLPFPPPGALSDPEIEPVSACVSCIAGVTLRLNIGNLIWEAMIRRCRARRTFHWKFIRIKFVFQRVYVYISLWIDLELTEKITSLNYESWWLRQWGPRSESHFHQLFTWKQILKDNTF